jgi:hypothetical protein
MYGQCAARLLLALTLSSCVCRCRCVCECDVDSGRWNPGAAHRMIDLSTVNSLSYQVLRSGGYNRQIWAMFARGNRDEEGVACGC